MYFSALQGFPAELILEIYAFSKNRNLMAVCTRFRDICYSTRLLWTTINVRKDQATVDGPVYLLRRLERGGSCLLDVNIQSEEPLAKVEIEMWRILTRHRDRFRTFTIQTDKMALCSKIMHKILIARGPPSFNNLQQLRIFHEHSIYKPNYSSASCRVLLQPMARLWPLLTTLHLPFVMQYLPYLSQPLLTLNTLILDGRMSTNIHSTPSLYLFVRLLVNMPRLSTIWIKCGSLPRRFDGRGVSIPPPDPDLGPAIRLPVHLPQLTRISLTTSSYYGIGMLHAIEAPCLKDLHLDGSYDMERHQFLNHPSVSQMDELLTVMAQRSPLLHRLALVDTSFSVNQWAQLFGFGSTPPLFQHLRSIAIRGVVPTTPSSPKLSRTMNIARLYECPLNGTIPLRRFAYTGMTQLLGLDALCKLVTNFSPAIGTGEYFELEVDNQEYSSAKERIEELQQHMAVRTTLHTKGMAYRNWWTHCDEIDATEADSY